MKKILIGLVLLIAVLAIVGTIFVTQNLDKYIAETIATEGTAALGSQVTVESVETKLKDGIATINGLAIANPGGYKSAKAIKITSFSADVDYQNQLVEKILISKPVINAELKGTRSNFQDLLDNMPATEDTATEESSGDDIEITINSFQLRQATVNVLADKFPEQSFVMEDFVLNNLKGNPEQISERLTRELTEHVTKQVQDFATNAIAAIAIEEAKKRVEEEVNEKINEKIGGKLGDKLGGKLKGLKLKIN